MIGVDWTHLRAGWLFSCIRLKRSEGEVGEGEVRVLPFAAALLGLCGRPRWGQTLVGWETNGRSRWSRGRGHDCDG